MIFGYKHCLFTLRGHIILQLGVYLHFPQQLEELLHEEKLAGVPVLVFANKQDLPLALKASDVRHPLYDHCLLISAILNTFDLFHIIIIYLLRSSLSHHSYNTCRPSDCGQNIKRELQSYRTFLCKCNIAYLSSALSRMYMHVSTFTLINYSLAMILAVGFRPS